MPTINVNVFARTRIADQGGVKLDTDPTPWNSPKFKHRGILNYDALRPDPDPQPWLEPTSGLPESLHLLATSSNLFWFLATKHSLNAEHTYCMSKKSCSIFIVYSLVNMTKT